MPAGPGRSLPSAYKDFAGLCRVGRKVGEATVRRHARRGQIGGTMSEVFWGVALMVGAAVAFMASEVVRELERRHDEAALQETADQLL